MAKRISDRKTDSSIRRFMLSKVKRRLIYVLLLLVAVILVGVFADRIAPYPYMKANFQAKMKAPSLEHLFGTDAFGRDLFSRVIYGLRIALRVALISMVIQLSLGIVVGLVAGYFGGIIDRILSFIIDVFYSIPSMILAFAFVTVLGSSLDNAIIAVALTAWPNYARMVRTKTIELKGAAYIKIAVTYGESCFSIMFRYILPNLIPSIVVLTSTRLPNAIISTTALSFLGLGAQSPSPDWGLALSEATRYVTQAPWLSIFPGLALVLLTYLFSIVGEAMRDAADPNLHEL